MTTASQQSKSHFYLPFVLWSKNIFQENKQEPFFMKAPVLSLVLDVIDDLLD